MAEKTERIYTIPLRKAFDYSHKKRARKAVKLVYAFLARHMKTDEKNVRISEATNSLIWKRGITSPPRRIKVRVVREGEKAVAYLMDEKPGETKVRGKAEKKAEGKKEGKPAKEGKKPKAEKPKEEKKGEPPKEEKKEEKPLAKEVKKEEPKKEEKPSEKATASEAGRLEPEGRLKEPEKAPEKK